jgi:hypothetical protein
MSLPFEELYSHFIDAASEGLVNADLWTKKPGWFFDGHSCSKHKEMLFFH